MNHPHASIRDAESPSAPANALACHGFLRPAIEVGGVTQDGLVVREFLFILHGVVGAVAAANVVVVCSVCVEGVEVLASIVFDEGARIVPDNFDDLEWGSVYLHACSDRIKVVKSLTSPSLAGKVNVVGSQPPLAIAAS